MKTLLPGIRDRHSTGEEVIRGMDDEIRFCEARAIKFVIDLQ